MTTQEQTPSPDDLRRSALKRALDQYDYLPILTAWATGESFGLLDDRDTRVVQARLKHEIEQRDYLLAQADEHYRRGMTIRAGQLSYFAQLHQDTITSLIAYLRAVGADHTDFLAKQPDMFGGIAA